MTLPEIILYCLLSALCSFLSYTVLLTKRLRLHQYAILFLYLTANFYILFQTGYYIIGIFTMFSSAAILLFFLKEHYIWNLCLIFIGYLISACLNNLLLSAITSLGLFTYEDLGTQYANLFSLFFAVFLFIFLYLLRKIIYCYLHITDYFDMPRIFRLGIFTECTLSVLLYIFNIQNGHSAGYSDSSLLYNTLLFILIIFINLVLLIICSDTVKKEATQKYLEHQQKLSSDYIKTLENMNNEIKTFRHDYKNILCSISGYLREDKIDELKRYMSTQIQSADSLYDSQIMWSGLSSIEPLEFRVFLFEKLLYGLSQKLHIFVSADPQLSIVNINSTDLIRLLGIYLDNAFEAAVLSEERKIILSLHTGQHSTIITLENTFSGSLTISDLSAKGFSTKGRSHGIGLTSAGQILQKYKNIVSGTSIDKNRFIQRLEICE